MASVKVAVRVRPMNQREKDMNANLIVQMEGKKTRLMTVKNSKEQNDGTREKYKDFTFDHSYWSYDGKDENYASQEQVFSDLGVDVIESAFEGYNACVFAYGQTGSGKTFTMMGSPECQGLIPRICRQLFARMSAGKESGCSYRTEVSYLEIYNEKVKDLLSNDAGHSLRVREHPRLGPYVQDLSKHLVQDYHDIQECMHRGNLQRTTASTQMNDVSSRSHAIFTISFVQASYLPHNNMPCETVSKVHLVDLAGSERADATGATGQRLVEGAHINKSLVTLGSVISALAEASQQQSDASRTPKSGRKGVFIPYRDSVLTWLLKDSLGGNSKTIMIAAISPADCNYGETLSTLRYANRAKNIINKPTINEDPNVRLIRELREEIDKLRAQISHNTDPIDTENGVLATLQRKEAQEKVLTEKWTEKWRETQQILQEQKALGLRKSGLGVVLDSDMPHLIGIDDNLLSTGVTLYHLKEGETVIGTSAHTPCPDIVLSGAGVLPLHCRVTLHDGVATVQPYPQAHCWLNTVLIDKPAALTQGCILLLGRTNMFRYNDPAAAAALRRGGGGGGAGGGAGSGAGRGGADSALALSRLSLLSWSASDLRTSMENLNTTREEENDATREHISAQRAELERERQEFRIQQQERQKELLQAQRRLDEEREAMEREYSVASLRRRNRIKDRIQIVEDEEASLLTLQDLIDKKSQELEIFARNQLEELAARGHQVLENKDRGRTCMETLMQQTLRCDPVVRDALERQKLELLELESELEKRCESVASHRAAVERLRDTLDNCNDDGSPPDSLKRSKSELVLRDNLHRNDVSDPLSADERDDYRTKKFNLTLPLDDSQTTQGDETFHTATCESQPQFTPLSDTMNTPLSRTDPLTTPLSRRDPLDTPVSRSDLNRNDAMNSSTEGGSRMSRVDEDTSSDERKAFPTGPRGDDSDDMSSTEDYNKPRIIDGQSSSSIDQSPDERLPRIKYKRRVPDGKSRRPVTEAEALRAMQRICQRIASQKLLVISSLENDCTKEELNRQIAVLQELQKKYVRLEMALQYSMFPRSGRVSSIPEATSLSLSDKELREPRERDRELNGNAYDDPLHNRLKESEVEGSDNVSTSNDEHSECSDNCERSRTRSLVPREHTPTIHVGLTHPIDFSSVISIPGWVTRGAGARAHHEYEVRVCVGSERWALLRRYRRFRDLYLAASHQYGNKVRAIPFPSRQLFTFERVARSRRAALETFLRRLLETCAADPRSPLYAQPLTRHTLHHFSEFFRKQYREPFGQFLPTILHHFSFMSDRKEIKSMSLLESW